MMRRADRLFQIIQILRRSSRPVTAAVMAEELEVSTRTVYRDVADLIGQRVPIAGEAGFGYVLDGSFNMPALMFSPDEIEAVMLGAQWVAARSDKALAQAAQDVMAKIAAAVPEHLRSVAMLPSVGVRPVASPKVELADPQLLRQAVRVGRKLRLRYRTDAGAESDRTVWPVILGYSETGRMLVAWCELRQDFRHFRTDRITAMAVLPEACDVPPADLRRRWQAWRAARAPGT